jgi:hypothetical protein
MFQRSCWHDPAQRQFYIRGGALNPRSLFVLMRPMDELLREDARREGRGDRASGEFLDLQSGVREGAVRISGCTLGARIERGIAALSLS